MPPTVRELAPSEWTAFKEIRLRALRTEPGVYRARYADAVARSDAEWEAMLRADDGRVFGLYDGDALVGIGGAFVDHDDPSGTTGVLVMGYVDPAYRGRGGAKELLDARLYWFGTRRAIRRIRVGRCASNEAMRTLLERRSFRETTRERRDWHDGGVDDEVSYELTVAPVRDAATIIVARDVPGGIEVYMVRRSASSPAFPDVYVFPGGTVDASDRVVEGLDALRLAAIRETFEESGLLFADTPVSEERLRAMRTAVLTGTMPFVDAVRELGVRLDTAALHYFARRITPPPATHRFDARFFVARAPEGQVAEADAFETYDGRWVRPDEMLAAAERRDAGLANPTRRYLTRIRDVRDVASLIALAAASAPPD
jgi:8-oxo-dGTP pyrophosphatase MutT (NUDIX family)/RimJ/RimL family protein N-acetyltransferase